MNENQNPHLTYIDSEEEINLTDYLDILYDGRWLIVTITIIVLLAGLYSVWTATPIYRADALLQVEKKSSGIAGLNSMSDLLTGEMTTVTEIEIIRSRSIVGKAVEQLKLDISAGPHYLPCIGRAIARGNTENGMVTPGFSFPGLNLAKYAWGGESIKVDRLQAPPYLLGKTLVLTAGRDGAYKLADEDGNPILTGRTGETAVSEDDSTGLYVSKMYARPGVEFILRQINYQSAVERLTEKLEVKEKGKNTGILELTLEGSNPPVIINTLNAVADIYLRQNVDRLSAEAEKSLVFLQEQLPIVKKDLSAAETLLNDYRLRRESVDLTIETQAVLNQVVDLESSLSQLSFKKIELERQYTGQHPILLALNKQQQRLKQQQAELTAKIKQLPEIQQEILRFSRDVQVTTVIYTELLNKVQELKVVRAGTVGNVRILDYAVSSIGPVKPQKKRNLLLALILGLFGGIGLVFLRKAMHKGVEQPDQIEEQLGLSVYSAVPFSEKQKQNDKKNKDKLLAIEFPKDAVVESLRSLRTNLHFALLEAENNIVMITGPGPGIGKTFITANFGQVLADAGSRVLLIDADMRKGYMHRLFDIPRSSGLSELISGKISVEEAVHKTTTHNLDIVSTGILPPNPSELLMHENFQKLLKNFSREYDLIIIDTPPVLAVTDPSIIGRFSGTSFLVLRAGFHPMKEIEASLKRLRQNGVVIKGAIFNAVTPTRRYGYGKYGYGKYGYYNYEYNKD